MRAVTAACLLLAGSAAATAQSQSPVTIAPPSEADVLARTQWPICGNRKDQYTVSQRIAACTAIIEAGVEIPRRQAIAFLNRSTAHDENRDLARTLADLDEAIRINPSYAMAYNNRGFLTYKNGDLDRALADLDQAVRFGPELAIARNNRAHIYEDRGQSELAEADREAARALIARYGPPVRGYPVMPTAQTPPAALPRPPAN